MAPWAGTPETIEEAGWTLVMRYEDEGDESATSLIDLSHRPKALVVGPSAEALGPLDPGRAAWDGQAYVCCRKPSERILFDLNGPLEPTRPNDLYTDMTDAWALLAVLGPKAKAVMRRMMPIDFERPDLRGPFYAISRSHGIWVQLINPKIQQPGFLLACDRSHGQNLVEALFLAGRHLGLKPAGLGRLAGWLNAASPS
jgi:glycine cleavage system aminomethyltransferase T